MTSLVSVNDGCNVEAFLAEPLETHDEDKHLVQSGDISSDIGNTKPLRGGTAARLVSVVVVGILSVLVVGALRNAIGGDGSIKSVETISANTFATPNPTSRIYETSNPILVFPEVVTMKHGEIWAAAIDDGHEECRQMVQEGVVCEGGAYDCWKGLDKATWKYKVVACTPYAPGSHCEQASDCAVPDGLNHPVCNTCTPRVQWGHVILSCCSSGQKGQKCERGGDCLIIPDSGMPNGVCDASSKTCL